MKTRKRNRLAALLMCLCMMAGTLPISGMAIGAEGPDCGHEACAGQEACAQQETQTKETQKSLDNDATKEAAPPGEEQDSFMKVIPDALGDAGRMNVPVGTEKEGLALPAELTGTVNGKGNTPFAVTWACDSYDGNTPGEYTFTAALGEGYKLADNITLPQITVVVNADGASFVPFGIVDNNLYEINAPDDWDGLQAWLTNTAATGAVVQIKASGSVDKEIRIPNKNITIASEASGTVENLRLTSDEAVTLTIQNLHVSSALSASPYSNGIIDLASGSTLKFAAENNLSTRSYTPVIHVPTGKTLTLTGTDTASILDVTSADGAGIGGKGDVDKGEACGTVKITGGTVNATAGYGAGIGGGSSRATGGDGGKVAITGGTVNATAGYGAGIGGGGSNDTGGAGGTVEISGADTVVNAKSTNWGAGIGGGGSNVTGGDGGKVAITGGTVTATAEYGAGIGGGCGVFGLGGAGGTVEISSADTVVNAKSTDWGAGIGGGGSQGTGGAGGNVAITSGTVNATARYGAGISGGGSYVAIGGDGGKVAITGGRVTATAEYGAGIGGGGGVSNIGGAGGTVEISGADTVVNAKSTSWGAGIGGGGSSRATGGAGDHVAITGGRVTATAEYGAGIGGGFGRSIAGGASGTVEISGADTVVNAKVTKWGAGIGGGGSQDTGGAGGKVAITGGTVTATANSGAGIGGGFGRNIAGGASGTVEISGADTVIDAETTGWAAGIGGGGSSKATGGAGDHVAITGGTVTTTAKDGVGIGGGRGETANGAGGTLTVDSTGAYRTILDMRGNGTNATTDHSIGTCEIKDATGALTGFYSKLTVTGGTADNTHAQKAFWKQGIVKSGAAVSVTADTPPQGKWFSGWTAAPALPFADASAAATTFVMPETAQTMTAGFKANAAPAITGDTSMTVAYGYAATSSGAYTITGGPAPGVRLDKDYDGKITWNDDTKKLDIGEGLGVGTYPVTLTTNNGVDPEAKHTFTLTVTGIAPAIIAQPQGASYTAGQGAAPLTITAQAADDGTLSYQWYQNTANSHEGGSKIEGSTEKNYTPDTHTAGTVYYYCVVTSSYGGGIPSLSTASGTAAILVTTPGHEVVTRPEDGKPIDLTKDAVFGFAGEYANLAAIRLNGNTLLQTPISGTQAELSGYPGYTPVMGNAKAGSVMVTLYKEFLQTLPDGKYTLEVEFLDGGETSVGGTPFEIRREEVNPLPGTATTEQPSLPPTEIPSDNPSTGDQCNLWAWALILLAAGGGIGAAAYRRRMLNHDGQK